MLFKPSITNRRRYFAGEEPRHGKKVFIKRSATAEETSRIDLGRTGRPFTPPHRHKESLRNEALAIAFIQEHTSIPVPSVVTTFEDRDCFYLVQELIEVGISATQCAVDAEPIIIAQLEKYMAELHSITSDHFKSFIGKPLFPARFKPLFPLEDCSFPTRKGGYVLCHGDIGWQNIIVDPTTYKILHIIDWEYAGFYPVELEGKYWKRKGLAHWNRPDDISDGDAVAQLLSDLIFGPQHEAALKMTFPTPPTRQQSSSVVEEKTPNPEVNVPQTELQRKLLALDLDHPAGQPVSMSSINDEQLLLARQMIGENLIALANDLREEDRVLRGWVVTAATNKKKRSKKEAFESNVEFQVELAAMLPPLFQALGDTLRQSASQLIPHRDYIYYMDIETARLEKDKSVDKEDRIKAIRKMNDEKRALADQAARHLEMDKWKAVRQFSEKLLVIAHAAEQHFEWYPSYDDCPPRRDEEGEGKRRWDFELRLRNLITDGSGGWKAEIREMTVEEYTPLEWKGNLRLEGWERRQAEGRH